MPFREAELELVQRRLIEIRPKIGTYVSLIDAELVEEVRHLRAVLEIDLAEMACQMLNNQQLDHLWENVALWQMYIQRAQEEKIFALDKGFHRLLYVQCGCPYWYDLVENLAPHFDRTTVLSFRCRPAEAILDDHRNEPDAPLHELSVEVFFHQLHITGKTGLGLCQHHIKPMFAGSLDHRIEGRTVPVDAGVILIRIDLVEFKPLFHGVLDQHRLLVLDAF